MLRKKASTEKECEACTELGPLWDGPLNIRIEDFNVRAQLSIYTCVKQKTCPICGSKGSTETYLADDFSKIFRCDKFPSSHIYEVDDTNGLADRVHA